MRVAVLGGGVIGVTSAYYLACAGHQVSLVERRPGPAMETSFANAGEISPGYAAPWASPDVPRKAVKWLMMEHAPLILRPKLDQHMLTWLVAMLRNCTAHAYAINKARMVRLAEYSRAQLMQLRSATGIQYEERAQGTLQLFRSQAQLDGVGKDIEVLRRDGVRFELLDKRGCIAVEPGLAHATTEIAGGLRLPGDETGDCYKFTKALAAIAAEKGVQFRFGDTVLHLDHQDGLVESVTTDRGSLRADAFVVALGSYSPALVRPLDMNLPVYPVKGYSLNARITSESRAPVSTVMDESFKIAITRLGEYVRVGGMAQVSGFEHSLPLRRRKTLEQSVEALFPGAADVQSATFWSGLRPMTPDGTPVVGPTEFRNLFLNTGHGTLGWTMACGSARVLSDMMSGVTPEIDVRDLSIDRYARQ